MIGFRLMNNSLVRPLFSGPLDIVGDIHGEFGALLSLLEQLGYDREARNPAGRRLVFLGDLVDRGPDSPAVVALVAEWVRAGRAQCVLGNHELNLLLGEKKHDNHWFFGEPWSLDGGPTPTPAVLADDDVKAHAIAFFATLPLALHRDDLRIVHACWDDAMIEIARTYDDAKVLLEEYEKRIDERHRNSALDKTDQGLAHQNENPAKVLTSGFERRIATPFLASGRMRYEERVPWWETYAAETLCLYGHYSRLRGQPGSGPRAWCLDYGAAKRWQERLAPDFDGRHLGHLAALRMPERELVFDHGQRETLSAGPP